MTDTTPQKQETPSKARFGHRFYALAIDSMLLLILLIYISPDFLKPDWPESIQLLREQFHHHEIDTQAFNQGVIHIMLEEGGWRIALLHLLIDCMVMAGMVIACWMIWGTTPGKKIFALYVVDASTLTRAKWWQYLLRAPGYALSFLPACLGFLWSLWDKNNQCWHDKISHTKVICTRVMDQAWEEKRFRQKTGLALGVLILYLIFYYR